MITNVSKICSFLLLFLFTVLSLNQFEIISYSEQLKYIFYFVSLLLIMFSSVTTLLTNKSGFFKFISIAIMACLAVGGISAIIQNGFNIFLYVSVIFTAVYSLVDMFYKIN
ncbi:MAG: hypothetical protein E7208_04740 [Clostridium butyricum]|nr:hypothetical protein [Clostridium butyricum]